MRPPRSGPPRSRACTAVAAGVPAADRGEAAWALRDLSLARSAVDRTSHHRTDQAWLAAAWADEGTRVLVLDHGQALIRFAGDAAALELTSPGQAPEGVRFLLGVDDAGIAYFGVDGPRGGLGAGPLPAPGSSPAVPPEPGVHVAGLRQAGPLLGDRDAGLFTQAVALANWHATHTHCPRCGAVTEPIRRLRPALPGGRQRALPPRGSGGDHAGPRRWRPLPAGAQPQLAAPAGVHPGRLRGAGGIPGTGGDPRGRGGDRAAGQRAALRREPAVADAAQPDARLRGPGPGRAGDRRGRGGDRRGAVVHPGASCKRR